MLFLHLVVSFASIMLLTDPPELVALPEDQIPSAESFIALSQCKMDCFKWTPIFNTVKKGSMSKARSKVIHLFLHEQNNWMEIHTCLALIVELSDFSKTAGTRLD